MQESNRYVGQWWLPDTPDKRVGGILIIDANGKALLELTDELLGEREVEIVYGVAAGKHITLIQAFRASANIVLGQTWTTAEIVRVSMVFVGMHMKTELDEIFSSAEVELACLTDWADHSGLEVSTIIDTDSRHFRHSDIAIRIPEKRSVAIDGTNQELQIFWMTNRNGPNDFTYGRNVRVTETARLRVICAAPSPWTAFNSTIRAMQNLVTLAAQQGCAIRARKFFIPQEDGRAWPVDLYLHESVEWEDVATQRHKFLFHLSDLSDDYAATINTWFQLRDDIGLALDVLFGLDYLPTTYYENELFNAASAAEGIHAALCPESTDLPADMHAQIVETAKSAFSKGESKNWVAGRLGSNHPGIKKRFIELASIPDSQAVEQLLGDPNTWAQWLRNARNAVGHLSTGELERKIPEKARYRLAAVTKALLHLVLLEKLSVSHEVQQRAVQDIYRYAAREFKDAVINS